MAQFNRQRILRAHKTYLWAIFLIPACFVLFQFVIQFSSGIIITDLMHSLGLNAIGASVLASSYYYVYIFMQMPAGLLADRVGPRILLTAGALICGVGAAIFMLANSLWMAVVGRVLMGAGMSCGFVSALFLYRNWFSTRVFALLVSLLEALALIFTGLGNIVIASMAQYASWRSFTASFVVLAAIFAVVNFLVIRNSRRSNKNLKALTVKAKPTAHFLQDLKQLFTSKKALMNGFFCGVMTAPQTVFVALWGIPFLMHVYHFSVFKATIACSTIFLGIAVVGPITGSLYNKTDNHHIYFSLSALITAALMAIAIFIPLNFYLLIADFILLGMFSSTYLWCYVKIHELVPSSAASTSIGFANMMGLGAAPVIQLLISFILHTISTHDGAQAAYSGLSYQVALGVLPLLFVLAAACGYWVRASNQNEESVIVSPEHTPPALSEPAVTASNSAFMAGEASANTPNKEEKRRA